MGDPVRAYGRLTEGVIGTSETRTAVFGLCQPHAFDRGGYGVHGYSPKYHGVVGETSGAAPPDMVGLAAGVLGHNFATQGSNYPGIIGISESSSPGVMGICNVALEGGSGVEGRANSSFSPGVNGTNTNAVPGGTGVSGNAYGLGNGVSGRNWEDGPGVHGFSFRGPGVYGHTLSDTKPAIYGQGTIAGRFEGPVTVTGLLTKSGGGFRIDHPREPANKYLNHSFVESDEMKNVYDGIVTLDGDGAASVDLPEWFEALNGDFRYQLTAIGGAAPNLHVAEEIYEGRFKIAGGQDGKKVCWQVTGSRKDPWAAANPFEVEEDKPQEERGRYLQPSLYGAPDEQSVTRAHMGEMREPPQPPQLPQPPQIEPLTPPDVSVLETQQIAQLRDEIEELKRGRVEEEIDELRRQIKKLRRRRKR